MPILKQCAFLTMQDLNGFFCYDHLAIEPLAERGWEVTMIPWNDEYIDWNRFDAVVVRSPWDYQKTPHHFLQVLTEIDASSARLFNSLEICRWNMDKTYLRQLGERDVPLIPTVWLAGLQQQSIPELFQELSCDRLVFKPTIGAGAVDTFVVEAHRSASWTAPQKAFQHQSLIVQPFVESVITEGEYSLFYFGGQFSHAIVKQPKPADFRVQEEHGGIIRSIEPNDALLQAAEVVLNAVGETLLYARVDLLRYDQQLVLIELEVIEPSLYFSYDSGSAARFAAALDRMAR